VKLLSAVLVTLVFCASTFQVAAEDQSPTKPATQVCVLKVSGMTCAGCEAAVKIAARSVEGVKDVKASYAKKNAEVIYDPSKTSPNAIAKVITDKSGFKAEPVESASKGRPRGDRQ